MKILVLKEKHGDRYISLEEDPYFVYYRILSSRVEEGFYGEDLEKAKQALLEYWGSQEMKDITHYYGKEKAPRDFLMSRNEEYEEMFEVELEELT